MFFVNLTLFVENRLRDNALSRNAFDWLKWERMAKAFPHCLKLSLVAILLILERLITHSISLVIRFTIQ